MFPDINEICAVDTSVQALLGNGNGSIRMYPFGVAQQNEIRPYVVWQVIYGAPENYLGHLPNTDRFGVQIDVYAKEADEAREVAVALFAALESEAHVVGFNGELQEPITLDYRYSFTVERLKYR